MFNRLSTLKYFTLSRLPRVESCTRNCACSHACYRLAIIRIEEFSSLPPPPKKEAYPLENGVPFNLTTEAFLGRLWPSNCSLRERPYENRLRGIFPRKPIARRSPWSIEGMAGLLTRIHTRSRRQYRWVISDAERT